MSFCTNNFEKLEWDSQCFGYPVARISNNISTPAQLEAAIQELFRLKFKLVYFFISPDNHELNKTALKLNGFLVDKKVTYYKKIEHIEIKTNDILHISEYDKNYVSEDIKNLALQAGEYSRFKIDPNFKNGEFNRIYETWIKRSILKEIAFLTLIVRINEEMVGMMTLGQKNERGDIGLVAVKTKFRGKGIGRDLVSASQKIFYEKGFPDIQVVTQKDNFQACRLYEHLGFYQESIYNVYHFWLPLS